MRPNLQETADLVTFTEEILNGKLHFLYSVGKRNIRIFSESVVNTWKFASLHNVSTTQHNASFLIHISIKFTHHRRWRV